MPLAARQNFQGARELYDEWAPKYDATLLSWGYQAHRRVAEQTLLRCGNDLQMMQGPAHCVVDLGCGTGLAGEAPRRD